MNLKRSNGVPASALECTWCDRAQLRSNARSKFERTPRRPMSRAVALASPSFHRFQPCAVAVCAFECKDHDRMHASVRSNAWPAFERNPLIHFILI
jgi:hypothetical protein